MEENKKSGAAVQQAPAQENKPAEAAKKPEAPKDDHKYGFSFVYWLLVRVFYVFVKILYGVRIEGKENIPHDRNIIVMGNHQFDFDPVMLAICDMNRQYHFMGKKELWNNKMIAWLWNEVHGFPVDRGNYDMGAIRMAMNILKRGECLGIFPEGTRHKGPDMLPLLSGAAMIALRSKCDIVPIYIDGNYKPFTKMVLRVGKPVEMSDLLEGRIGKDTFDTLMGRVEESFFELSGGKSRAKV